MAYKRSCVLLFFRPPNDTEKLLREEEPLAEQRISDCGEEEEGKYINEHNYENNFQNGTELFKYNQLVGQFVNLVGFFYFMLTHVPCIFIIL